MATIVEFVGLPASGKTTLAGQLRSALLEAGFPASELSPGDSSRFGRKLAVAWKHRRAVVPAARSLLGDSRPMDLRLRGLRWLVSTITHHDAAETLPADAFLIQSEGIAQRALLAFLDASNLRVSEQLGRYLRAAPPPDLMVRLRIDPDISVRRQLARRQNEIRPGRRFLLEPERLHTVMAAADDLLSEVVDTMRLERSVDVIEIDVGDWDSAIHGISERVLPEIQRRHRQQTLANAERTGSTTGPEAASPLTPFPPPLEGEDQC